MLYSMAARPMSAFVLAQMPPVPVVLADSDRKTKEVACKPRKNTSEHGLGGKIASSGAAVFFSRFVGFARFAVLPL